MLIEVGVGFEMRKPLLFWWPWRHACETLRYPSESQQRIAQVHNAPHHLDCVNMGWFSNRFSLSFSSYRNVQWGTKAVDTLFVLISQHP